MADLRVDLGFLKLRNPVLAASGTFGYGLEYEPFLDLNSIGGIIVKGLYFGPREGNPPPRLVETASGLINAIGLQGVGVEKFANEILPQLLRFETAILVNVCGSSDEEYIKVIEFLDRHEGIAAYELNISCPNVEQNGMCPALDSDRTFSLVQMAKQAGRRPIIAKLSPNVTDVVEIAQSAEEAGADGLSLINTILAMAVDIETRRPKLANIFGGLSGPAIKPIALRMVYQVASAVEIPVVGMGGIMSGADAIEFMIAGAKAIEVGTANFVDPGASVRIAKEIQGYCLEKKIARVEDIVGTLKVE